ncbi:MAG: hypothetical protein JEY91_04285 [Spirochaetaceae bacterium]|nr:hypothetical protein [Spirochaetaceae bacterium]
MEDFLSVKANIDEQRVLIMSMAVIGRTGEEVNSDLQGESCDIGNWSDYFINPFNK